MEFKKLQKIIAEVLGIGDMEIFQEMSFVDDLGADSLELFQILMGVEQEFDISIDEESLKDVGHGWRFAGAYMLNMTYRQAALAADSMSR